MATKKAFKKVEIADDSMLNLKKREKQRTEEPGQKVPVSFNRHRIEESVSMKAADFGYAPSVVTDESMMDRSPRAPIEAPAAAPKFDQDELHKRMESFAEKLEKAVIKVSPSEGGGHGFPPNVAAEPRDLIKVKFEKFVQLVATKDFLSILERNKNEDVILSSNLLTELASAVEEKGERKSPVIFLVGLAIGVIVTYLLINH